MDLTSESESGIAFGRFRVVPRRRELLADGRPLKLGGRAYDVLLALIEAQGAIVGKDTLLARVWPDRAVGENALEFQISTLRAALGAERDLIRTVPRRGYQFTGEIGIPPMGPDDHAASGEASAQPPSAPPPANLPPASLPRTNLPEPLSELIGRHDQLQEVMRLAAFHRLITLTGPGGIGKTRLAIAIARELLPEFPDGVWLAELSTLADPGLVPAVVAAAAGLQLAAGDVSAQRIAQALAGRRLLLVLDTCEHVIGAAAELAEALLLTGSRACVIATSREALRTEGEQIYPVPPLALPAEGDDPWQCGAVRLFAARARGAGTNLPEARQVGLALATICRRLDGIPLAIELAAARASTLGITQLAARLDDRFHLLAGGRRTALPRQQTLRATLDWSHDLLSEAERILLRRLAVFAGFFSLESASAIAADPEHPSSQIVEGVSDLVAKSLISADSGRGVARYRLLDTMRAYAQGKLDESGEGQRLARRHAERFRDLFERAEAEWDRRPTAQWSDDHCGQIDNLRAALDWAFSRGGDASVGVALTVAAIPLWFHLSLLHECSTRVEQALSHLAAGAIQDPPREMKLYAALGASSLYSKGTLQELGAAWAKALRIAERLHDAEYELRSLWGLWAFHLATGEWRITLGIAERFRALASDRPDPNERAIADRMIGFSRHYLGDQAAARVHLERMLASFVPDTQRSNYAARFQFDQRVAARAMLGRVLWLQGFPDQAMRAVESAVDEARGSNAISMCYALTLAACTIALWVGDLVAAERYVGLLRDYSARHDLPAWGTLGLCHQGVLRVKGGDIQGGLKMLRAGFDEAGGRLYAMNHVMLLGEMAEGLGRAGEVAEGLAAVEQAIERSTENEEGWVIAELLRMKGALLLLRTQGAAPMAEDHFRQALDLARRQGALSWELRAATSLAGLLRDRGRPAEAQALLQPVYDRFTEGFGTADLKAARALLDAVRGPPADDGHGITGI